MDFSICRACLYVSLLRGGNRKFTATTTGETVTLCADFDHILIYCIVVPEIPSVSLEVHGRLEKNGGRNEEEGNETGKETPGPQ